MSAKHELISNVHERSERNKAFWLLWRFSKWFGTVQALESLPEQGTPSEFCQAIVTGLNLEVSTQLPEWAQSETGHGVLIYGPHSFHLEPYILLSVLSQRDVYFVAQQSARLFTPQAYQDKLLLVSPSHLAHDARKIRGIGGIMQRAKRALFASEDMRSTQEIKETNLQTLHRASELLKDGKVVIIFPTASANIYKNNWHAGIGQIIAPLVANNANVLLQPFDITNLSFIQLLFELRKKFVKHKLGSLIPVEIGWEGAQNLADMQNQLNDSDPNKIVRKLRDQYTANTRT
ncbi:hypothetical protein KA078_03335 [Candidatus Woesebacteria bacterium]|nr:hypothetical protein [Candidatus Woesebacteria bacterium]